MNFNTRNDDDDNEHKKSEAKLKKNWAYEQTF